MGKKYTPTAYTQTHSCHSFLLSEQSNPAETTIIEIYSQQSEYIQNVYTVSKIETTIKRQRGHTRICRGTEASKKSDYAAAAAAATKVIETKFIIDLSTLELAYNVS